MGLLRFMFFLSQCRMNSERDKVIEKVYMMLVRDTGGQAKKHCIEDLVGYIFFFFFFFLPFLGLLLQHVEVPKLGVESEL